ncbi:MAG: metal-dependent hydrolase [archaeon]
MVKIHFLGHSSFKLVYPHTSILIDPFINNTCIEPSFKRLIDSPVKENELNDVSLILVSHEHFDHFDKKAIESIAQKNNSVVVGHESVLQKLKLHKRFLCPITIGQKIELRKLAIEGITAHHPNSFFPIGFLIDSGKEKIYHAGDTDLIDEFDEIKADIALLPIGGTYTMDLVDGVKATKSMKPKIVIPMHYNTFSMIKADALEFKHKIEKSLLETKPVILKPGESFHY